MPAAPVWPLVAVLGPTASGKSELALSLAGAFDGEIVNCDSLQLYRGLDIGTAKTPAAARRGIPHHLIDILDPDQECDAGHYAELARGALEEIRARGRLPVLAGGTGFYARALLDGLAPGPRRDPEVRQRLQRLEQRRVGALHRLLACWDPPTAARIGAQDVQKLVRALEICLLAGKPASQVFAAAAPPLAGYACLKLVLNPDREALRERIRERTREMFRQGLVEEVRGLLADRVGARIKPLEAIGYKESAAVIEGRISAEQAVELTFYATCQYAKRQTTWFRRERGAVVISGFGQEFPTQLQAARIVREFLENLHPHADSPATKRPAGRID